MSIEMKHTVGGSKLYLTDKYVVVGEAHLTHLYLLALVRLMCSVLGGSFLRPLFGCPFRVAGVMLQRSLLCGFVTSLCAFIMFPQLSTPVGTVLPDNINIKEKNIRVLILGSHGIWSRSRSLNRRVSSPGRSLSYLTSGCRTAKSRFPKERMRGRECLVPIVTFCSHLERPTDLGRPSRKTSGTLYTVFPRDNDDASREGVADGNVHQRHPCGGNVQIPEAVDEMRLRERGRT